MTILTILPFQASDMPVPPITAIIDRASELHADAQRMSDDATAAQLDNLIKALKRGMRMAWSLGDLLVTSASTPGVVYTVSCGRCNCPAWKPCKHLKLFELLIDMQDTLAGDADIEADCDELPPVAWRIGAVMQRLLARAIGSVPPDSPPGDDLPDDVPPTARHFGQRIALARRNYAYAA